MKLNKNGYPECVLGMDMPSESTLRSMKKAEIIELIYTAQHNYRVVLEYINNLTSESKCKTCPLRKGEMDFED